MSEGQQSGRSWFGAMANRFESFVMLISRYPMRLTHRKFGCSERSNIGLESCRVAAKLGFEP